MRDIIESKNILSEIKASYVGDCPVIKFNNDRLYYKDNNDRTQVKHEQLLIF